jgi:hypothetical protein
MPGRLAVFATLALAVSAFGLPIGGPAIMAAHADSGVAPSSPALTAPSPSPGDHNCTVTKGYWRNHPESWLRVTSIALGSVAYDQQQLIAILDQPVRGNGLVSLAHELIAAKLNLLLGAVPPPEVTAGIAQADSLIGALVVPPIGSGSLNTGQTSGLTRTLDSFNAGAIGPGHCPDSLGIVPGRTSTWGTLKAIYR